MTDSSSKKTILLDGGMGQELIRRSKNSATALWSTQVLIDEPDIVTQLHLDYIKAGAEIITLSNYSATPERLARENLQDRFEAIQHAAIACAQNARSLSDSPSGVRIAGCLPPLVASYRPELLPEKMLAIATYQQLVAVQADAVDLFICETMGSIDEAMYAASAALESAKPVWVSLTINDTQNSSTLRSGEAITDALKMLSTLPIEAILLNCSWPESIDHALPILAALIDQSEYPMRLGAYANGFTSIENLKPGGTVSSLSARTDLGPEDYATHASNWLKNGANIIGGCCEVGPAHISKLRQLISA